MPRTSVLEGWRQMAKALWCFSAPTANEPEFSSRASVQLDQWSTSPEDPAVAAVSLCPKLELQESYRADQPLPSPATSVPSSLDEVLTLGPLLGTGTFGSVYQGRWRNKIVAVKVLATSKHSKMLKSEISICALLEHPNVVACYCTTQAHQQGSSADEECAETGKSCRTTHDSVLSLKVMRSTEDVTAASCKHASSQCSAVHGVALAPGDKDGSTNDATYIVMELCAEGSLGEACATKRFFTLKGLVPGLHAVLLRARDVAKGMAYIHSCNICHADLKCDNILLQTDFADPYGCTAKVADFGLSCVLEPDMEFVSVGNNFGTISHQAPEVFAQGQLCLASDVYAFGVVLWELVNVVSPYAGLHAAELKRRVCAGLRPSWPSHIPEMYSQLAEDCWNSDPACRPTFPDVVQRIDQLLGLSKQLQEACEQPLRELHEWMCVTF